MRRISLFALFLLLFPIESHPIENEEIPVIQQDIFGNILFPDNNFRPPEVVKKYEGLEELSSLPYYKKVSLLTGENRVFQFENTMLIPAKQFIDSDSATSTDVSVVEGHAIGTKYKFYEVDFGQGSVRKSIDIPLGPCVKNGGFGDGGSISKGTTIDFNLAQHFDMSMGFEILASSISMSYGYNYGFTTSITSTTSCNMGANDTAVRLFVAVDYITFANAFKREVVYNSLGSAMEVGPWVTMAAMPLVKAIPPYSKCVTDPNYVKCGFLARDWNPITNLLQDTSSAS